jgi:hypothetical protein
MQAPHCNASHCFGQGVFNNLYLLSGFEARASNVFRKVKHSEDFCDVLIKAYFSDTGNYGAG